MLPNWSKMSWIFARSLGRAYRAVPAVVVIVWVVWSVRRMAGSLLRCGTPAMEPSEARAS